MSRITQKQNASIRRLLARGVTIQEIHLLTGVGCNEIREISNEVIDDRHTPVFREIAHATESKLIEGIHEALGAGLEKHELANLLGPFIDTIDENIKRERKEQEALED